MKLNQLIGTQPIGGTTSQNDKDIVNYILKSLKSSKTAWRSGFKSELEVNAYKEQLLIACIENKINSMELVEFGLKNARKDDSDFLPSVGKFIQWCKPDPEHWEHLRIEKSTQEFNAIQKALPNPSSKEHGLKAIREMKKKFGIV